MGDRDGYKCSTDCHRSSGGADGQGKGSKKIATAAKVVRAITSIVVFGVPLIAGTTALLGYGIHKAYRRMTGRS
jgi:hypothetical protein